MNRFTVRRWDPTTKAYKNAGTYDATEEGKQKAISAALLIHEEDGVSVQVAFGARVVLRKLA